jgi:polysaccharide biosynthesis protein PslH
MSKIVFITSRFPYPISKGDQLRVFFQLKSLSRKNEVHLIALSNKKMDQNLVDNLSFCKSISVFPIPLLSRVFSLTKFLFNEKPFQVGYFYNDSVRESILQRINQFAPNYIHCHLLRTAEYAKNIKGIEKSLDFMDAFSIGMKKRGDIEKNLFKKFFLLSEYKRLKKYEREMFNYFDRFTIISDQDAHFIDHPRSGEIIIVPNGVDFDSFNPRKEGKKYDICFMGNMSYPPNIEAIKYTITNIFPLLLRKKPNLKFLIAGANPTSYIQHLQSQNIDVIENFNHISDSIAMSKIMISPMVVSIGLQNKIIQAMAMKVPNVVSKSANKAIHAKHDLEILEAEKPNDYIEAIMTLLENKNLYNSIIDNAFRFVKEKYNWEKVNAIFEHTIKGSSE